MANDELLSEEQFVAQVAAQVTEFINQLEADLLALDRTLSSLPNSANQKRLFETGRLLRDSLNSLSATSQMCVAFSARAPAAHRQRTPRPRE
jgi:hypothetical protein